VTRDQGQGQGESQNQNHDFFVLLCFVSLAVLPISWSCVGLHAVVCVQWAYVCGVRQHHVWPSSDTR